MIVYSCPGCGGRLTAPDGHVGWKQPCLNCGLPLEVPTHGEWWLTHKPPPIAGGEEKMSPPPPIPATTAEPAASPWTWKDVIGASLAAFSALVIVACAASLLYMSVRPATLGVLGAGAAAVAKTVVEVILGLLCLLYLLLAAVVCMCPWLVPVLIVWLFSRPARTRCAYCGSEDLVHVSTTETGSERGYGLVTREGSRDYSWSVDGRFYHGSSNSEWTARAPVIRTYLEDEYHCRGCGKWLYYERVEEEEDFSRR